MKSTAQLFKALSEEVRLRIINLLATGELCVCDLMAVLDLPQSTVSRHLAYLRNCGLVTDRREGVWMYYKLAAEQDAFRQQLVELLQIQLNNLPNGAADRVKLSKHKREGC